MDPDWPLDPEHIYDLKSLKSSDVKISSLVTIKAGGGSKNDLRWAMAFLNFSSDVSV